LILLPGSRNMLEKRRHTEQDKEFPDVQDRIG
jgi:hypothetical protein